MYLFCVFPIAASAIVISVFYCCSYALMHAAFSVTATALLIDGVTADFRVIPFTCAWLPGRQNLPYTLALFLSGMGIFSQALAAIDLFLMHDPPRLFVYLASRSPPCSGSEEYAPNTTNRWFGPILEANSTYFASRNNSSKSLQRSARIEL